MNGFVDAVFTGPDFSGTSTQLSSDIFHPDYDAGSVISHLVHNKGYAVKDIRGTEDHARFHSEAFEDLNKNYMSLNEFFEDSRQNNPKYSQLPREMIKELEIKQLKNKMFDMENGLNGYKLLTRASMVKNSVTSFIDPINADVWIMEEPTYRGAGSVIRSFETKRSEFNSGIDQLSTTLSFQPDRVSEYYRFRKPLRDACRIILRSRSEESACYQMADSEHIVDGVRMEDYIKLPGNALGFQNPPTHIFVVCGPENWDKNEYMKLKSERLGKRVQDDFESRVDYQLLINNRYASNWLEELYYYATKTYNSRMPKIYRFDIYDSKEATRAKMCETLDNILKEDFSDKIRD